MPELAQETPDFYDREAHALIERYESVAFEEAHADVLDLLPDSDALILDVGAGSGRDAAWFAQRGHAVIAVEPAGALRAQAASRHPSARIRWLDDRLPALDGVFRTHLTFDLIWLSAVWMHVAPTARERAFRKLSTLLRPGGTLMLSLREGPLDDGRRLYPAPVDEVEKLARSHGLSVTRVTRGDDRLGRAEVTWTTVCLQAPDDGTGALPLLRHVIVNDAKASTYKLALLRVLVRIADSATGLVEDLDDRTVAVPLGLVALYWIRVFKPLIEAQIPQKPPNRKDTGLGFVKAGFSGLRAVSPYSLRVGAKFSEAQGAALHAALRDARSTIVHMPAHFITYPGRADPIFVAEPTRAARAASFALDGAFLRSFGRLRVPRHLWQAMGRYATWIEPALLNEWTALMQGYEGADRRSYDEHLTLLRWLEPEHDTRLVRQVAHKVRERTGSLFCLWSGRRLHERFAVDHCLPFAAWPCNDLWNLFPAHPALNQVKGDRLPSATSLAGARERILDWWQSAFIEPGEVAARFYAEAAAALPGSLALSQALTPEDVFDGLLLQRTVLRRDQQLAEWANSQ